MRDVACEALGWVCANHALERSRWQAKASTIIGGGWTEGCAGSMTALHSWTQEPPERRHEERKDYDTLREAPEGQKGHSDLLSFLRWSLWPFWGGEVFADDCRRETDVPLAIYL